jgi:putative oxygen-independent coproporphyrinogen III oxidase
VELQDWQYGGFGLYVHWPYCQSKCPYCDFNSHVAAQIDHARWLRAYLCEIERLAVVLPGRRLDSIYFGGGTPSLMSPEVVAAVIEAACRAWKPATQLEITLEANPTSVEAGRFAAFRNAGVNRVSIGIQALNDEDLRRLGRLHSAKEARQAFEIARQLFDRVSFDLIYARQHQTLDDWRRELTDALDMAVDHLSLYQLTIEPGTVFGARQARGRLPGLPQDELSADMYALTQDICQSAGMAGYEISNHARPGAESRHNLVYWRYGDFAGIGPGAHGRLSLAQGRVATESLRDPAAWLDMVERTACGEVAVQVLNGREQAEEYLMMSLRLAEGADIERYHRLAGTPLSPEKLDELQEMGMVRTDGGRLYSTAAGRMLLDAILRELLAG